MGRLDGLRTLARAFRTRGRALPPWAVEPNPRARRIRTAVAHTVVPLESADPLIALASPPGLATHPLRLVVRDDWYAVAMYAGDSAHEYRQFVRAGTTWMYRGGGGGGSGTPRPLGIHVGQGGSWSSPVAGPYACAAVVVLGTAAPPIASILIEFGDAHRAQAVLSNGLFVWFYAMQPPRLRSPRHGRFAREVLGVDPVRVLGLSEDGRELARQELVTLRR